MTPLPGEFLLACVITATFVILRADISAATEFDFGTLTFSRVRLLGEAHWINGSVRLTRDLGVPNSSAGKFIYSTPISFRRPGAQFTASFSTFFSFSVRNLNPSSIGGSLAFVISLDGESVGDAGRFIGIMSAVEAKGVIAVELDTLMDAEFKDIYGNHVGLDVNSMVSAQDVNSMVSTTTRVTTRLLCRQNHHRRRCFH